MERELEVTLTPADLRAMRISLGMTRSELGKLLGVGEEDVRQLERMRAEDMYEEHFKTLYNIKMFVQHQLSLASLKSYAFMDFIGRDGPTYLFTFPADEVFKKYEPALYAGMRFNSVHWAYSCRLLDEIRNQDGYESAQIVEIIPVQYEEHLARMGAKDELSQRVGWADAHLRSVPGMKPGYPMKSKFRTRAA